MPIAISPSASRLTVARAIAGALLLTATLPPTTAGAQAVLGVGDDALVLPRGVFRVRAIGQQVRFDERFGGLSTDGLAPNRRESVLRDLNIESIGTLQFPNLAPVQTGLRGLTGINDYSLSLGRSVATGGVNVGAGTLVAELGVTSRLSVGVVVPYLSTRNRVNLLINPNGEGNVGFNPGAAGGVPAARAQNTALVGQLLGAARAVEQAVGLGAGGCATATIQQCQLVNGVRQFAGGVGAIYGADAIPAAGFAGAAGSPFVPLGTSAAQQAIAARVQQFRTLLGAAGAGITTTAPFAAPQNLGLADAQRILTTQDFGVVAEPVETTTRRGLGDIEVAAKYSLLNTFGHTDPNARLTPTGVNVRSALSGVVRIGTGNADDPQNFLDVQTGTGAHAVGLRSTTDLLLGRRFWGSLALRYTAQLPDNQAVRVIDAPERVLAAQYRERLVRRDLGDFLEVEATPRVVLTDWLALAGQYYYRTKGEDRYRGTFTVPASVTGFGELQLDARTLNQETLAREQRVGGGLSFSSVQAFTAGRFPLPAELTYTLQQTVTGYGGAVPRLTLHQVQLRLYARAFGQ